MLELERRASIVTETGPPAVTIAIAARNAEKYLAEALASIAPSLAAIPHEIVLADGGSTDRTREIIQNYPAARLVSDADNGIYDGMNRAIAAARGGLLLLLNSDDCLEPGAVARMVALLERNPEVAFASANIVTGPERTTAIARSNSAPLSSDGILFGVPAINARLFRTSWLQRAGAFRTDAGLGADRDLLLRLQALGARGVRYMQPAYFYRSHAGSATLAGGPEGRLRVYRSDIDLVRAILAAPDLRSVVRGSTLQAFAALALLKLKRCGHPLAAHEALPALPRLTVADTVRGVLLNRKWRAKLSGY